jgi:hypothetical protein
MIGCSLAWPWPFRLNRGRQYIPLEGGRLGGVGKRYSYDIMLEGGVPCDHDDMSTREGRLYTVR